MQLDAYSQISASWRLVIFPKDIEDERNMRKKIGFGTAAFPFT